MNGYIFQVYYNSIYGKIKVDLIGKDINENDLNNLTLTARYEKSLATIFATAKDEKKGIAKIELIYKGEVVGEKEKPSGEVSWNIEDIGAGDYTVKAISNSGAIKYAYIKARNISNKLTTPSITIETESVAKNGWYGADGKDVYIKISTNSGSAKEIIYTLSGASLKPETTESLPEVGEGEEKSIRIKIEESGISTITAVTGDGEGNESEPNYTDIKFDNVKPVITDQRIIGTEGTNGWIKSVRRNTDICK
ncbi:MAG: hypothetical protein HFJ52_05325 [Clostridia bacterium]|nr:hypothetical protein [Clostridia bacterium]